MAPQLTVTRTPPEELARNFGPAMYRDAAQLGINVSQLMERYDPTSARDPEDRVLDAFERVVQASGIVVNPIHALGVRASTWEDAMGSPERRAMMHEFAARVWRSVTLPQQAPATPTIRAMLLSGDAALNTITNAYADDLTMRAKRLTPPVPLSRLLARTTPIDKQGYRSLYITDDYGTDAYRMKRVMQGADIPSTTLVTGEHYLTIHKYGRALRSTYEQLRHETIDRIAFIIQRMALQAEIDKVAIALDTIINGDGNSNTSATVITLTSLDAVASAGTLTLKGWLTFKGRFTAAYNPDVLLGQEASIMQLQLLPVNTVNGMPLIMLPSGGLGSIRPIQDLLAGGIQFGMTSDAPALKLVTIDSTMAIERVTEIGGNVSEVERFVTNQTQILTMTETEGYGVIDPNASKILNING